MINWLHSRINRPENGYDPVPPEHIVRYAEGEWNRGVNEQLLATLEEWVGGLEGKRVLDLGGGPGQYSIAFAKKGAQVTWHDISAGYRDFTAQKAKEHNVSINFSLGYLDEAPKLLGESFDLVFNRICWNYCLNDVSFARVIYALTKPGGVGYVDTTHSGWRREHLSSIGSFRTWLNDKSALKIGHPFPPHGRLAQLFAKMAMEKMLIDHSVLTNDRIFFQRVK